MRKAHYALLVTLTALFGLLGTMMPGTTEIYESVVAAVYPGTFSIVSSSVSCVNAKPNVSLTWTRSSRAYSYQVERKASGSSTWNQVASSLTDIAYVDTSFTQGSTVSSYTYRIVALRGTRKTYSSNTSTAYLPTNCVSAPTTPTATTTPPVAATTTAPVKPAATSTPPAATTTPTQTTPTTTPTTTQSTTTTALPAPVIPGKAPSWMTWGAYVGWQDSSMSTFESLVGKTTSADMVFAHWGNDPGFPSWYAPRIRDKGKTMVLFWEALDYNLSYASQPQYSFDTILAGKHDTYIRNFAAGAKAYGGPVILIPFSEFNGDWFPWGVSRTGNTPEKYIASYRYLRSFFTDAPNVKFAWVPNNDAVPDIPVNAIEQYYPGSAYVDYVGVDGFNFGGTEQQTFSQVFGPMLTRLKQYNKPIWIFSMGSAAFSGKAAWITDALTVQLYKYPEVKGWLWFNENKERDWRVNSDAASLTAFKTALP